MKLIIDKNEYWIKDDVILPSNFNSMDDPEKWTYIIDNKLIHREEEPAAIYSNGTKIWFLNGLCHRLDGTATRYQALLEDVEIKEQEPIYGESIMIKFIPIWKQKQEFLNILNDMRIYGYYQKKMPLKFIKKEQ